MVEIGVEQLRQHSVLNFASSELQMMLAKYGDKVQAERKQWVIGTWADCEDKLTRSCGEQEWMWKREQSKENQSKENKAGLELYDPDAYTIIRDVNKIILTGRNERATLYAVYEYAKEEWGLEWIYPGEDPIVATRDMQRVGSTIYQPSFTRRGFVYENLKDEPYLLAVVDWLAKNRVNELFTTVMLWDYLGSALEPELIKRGIHLTLGGHSMKFFLPHMTDKRQLDYTDMLWQTKVIADIVQYCQSIPMLTRISLWPEDAAAPEDASEKTPFLPIYIRFTEQLKHAFLQAGLEIEVEHIAYNAGLSWEMLELEQGTETSGMLDTLFAYWGRDYSQRWTTDSRTEDARAYAALERWVSETKRKNKQLCMFEYYSDHFMLSPLFPSLPKRIEKDLSDFRALGINQITNLVVPDTKSGSAYSWKWGQGYNSYLFARLAWGDRCESALHDYWQYAPAAEREFLRAAMDKIGNGLSKLTSFNIPLFPARAVDVKQVHDHTIQAREISGILKVLLADLRFILDYLQTKTDTCVTPFEMYFKHLYRVSQELEAQWKMKAQFERA